MAFRLKRRGSISDQLDSLVRREFRKALRNLTRPAPDEDAIHRARTSVKKIRAVLRLLHDALGPHDADSRRLRRVAHGLGRLRDLDATSETLRLLRRRYPSIVQPGVARAIARGLPSRKRRPRVRTGELLGRAVRAIRMSRRSVRTRVRRAGGRTAVQLGITRGYRRARSAMKNLTPDSDVARFHLWRRRVKDHSYHMQLCAALHATPRSRAARMAQLDRWLGHDHDLAALRTAMLGARGRAGDARARTLVIGCIDTYQIVLRERALKLGQRVLSDPPRRFRRSVKGWWR